MRTPDRSKCRLVENRRSARLGQTDPRYARVEIIERHAGTAMLACGARRCRIDQRALHGSPHLALKARHRCSAWPRACRRLLLCRAGGRLLLGLLRGLCGLRAHDRRLRLWKRRSRLRGSNLCGRRRGLSRRWSNLRYRGRLFWHRRSFRNHRRRICGRIGWGRDQRDLHRRRRRFVCWPVLREPANDGKQTEALQQQRSGERSRQRGAFLQWAEMIGCRDGHHDSTPTWCPSRRGRPGRCQPCDTHPSQREDFAALRCRLPQW
ncbi:hypothetical protein ACVINW_003891 [Bradyrhizobium sp. USDA 4461]